MDNVLHEINQNFIHLPEPDVRRNNEILATVRSSLIGIMRQTDPLFDAMFRDIFYGGSFYDGLRVGKPEEFDLDLLMDIPKYAQPELMRSKYPGFTMLTVHKFGEWMRQPEAMPAYRNFGNLFDNDRILNSDKTLNWMASLVQRSLNHFPDVRGIGVDGITLSRSGPALTLHIFGPGLKMDVDLVPSFVFTDDKWPRGFRPNPVVDKKQFFIVPKNPKGCENSRHHWRLSFQKQEMSLLNDKFMLKPTLRLLKKLRDTHNDTWIASYHIKTMFLHACVHRDQNYWQHPLSFVFLDMLKNYLSHIEGGNIPYFWDTHNNLIGRDVNQQTLRNVSKRLRKIIKTLEKNPDKPDRIAKVLLTPEEFQKFRSMMGWHCGVVPPPHQSPWNSWETTWESWGHSFPEKPPDVRFYICSSLFILSMVCIKIGKMTFGSTFLLLDALYISTYALADRPPLLIIIKFYSTWLVIIFTPLTKNATFFIWLYSATAVLELCVKFLSEFSINTNFLDYFIALCLLGFWQFSYHFLALTKIMKISFPLITSKISQLVKLTINYSCSPETVLTQSFKFLFSLPFIDLLFFGHFTLDHHLIVLTTFAVYYFGIVPDFDALVPNLLYLLLIKFQSSVIDKTLTYENICFITLMAGAAICKANPDDVPSNITRTLAVGAGLLLSKGVAFVLGNLGVNKYVIASMVLSCVGNSTLEIL